MIDIEKITDISNCKTLDEFAIHQINMWQKLYEEKCNELFEMKCDRDVALNTLQRSKGKWIKGDMFECDQCHHRMVVGDGAYNYCPNCGAEMEGEQ